MSDSTTTNKKEELRVMTPPFRVSFPNVFKPRAAFDGQEATYNLQMLFPKDEAGYPEELKRFGTDLKTVKKAMAKAVKEKWGDNKPNFKHKVIRDGAEKNLDEYKDMFFINAKSKFKPGIVDRQNEEIIDPSEFYAGCWARATVNVYTYDGKFGAGVSLGLQNLQFLKDDESFSGKRNAKDDFEAIDSFDDVDTDDGEDFEDDF